MSCTDNTNDINNALHKTANDDGAPTVTLRYGAYMN